jgi:hypothetical protein
LATCVEQGLAKLQMPPDHRERILGAIDDEMSARPAPPIQLTPYPSGMPACLMNEYRASPRAGPWSALTAGQKDSQDWTSSLGARNRYLSRIPKPRRARAALSHRSTRFRESLGLSTFPTICWKSLSKRSSRPANGHSERALARLKQSFLRMRSHAGSHACLRSEDSTPGLSRSP